MIRAEDHPRIRSNLIDLSRNFKSASIRNINIDNIEIREIRNLKRNRIPADLRDEFP